MKTLQPQKQINIANVIKSRLAYQSTQELLLREFQIKKATFENIISSGVIERLRLWDEGQRKAFYVIVGGANYMAQTKEFFHEKLKVTNLNINQKVTINTGY